MFWYNIPTMKIIKKVLKKLVVFIILPVLAIIAYLLFTGTSLTELSEKLGLTSLSKANLANLAEKMESPSDILGSASSRLGEQVRVKGTVHYLFRNPDYLGSQFSIGDLALKVTSAEREVWADALNQEKKVEGILSVKSNGENTLYYLDNPKIIE
jgi:hypothetical protein